ncbi:hypothetical protein SOPP22_17880 [Shewanella sp. OPT22]|nr:hypothetical protein SOPP22_17880 [Shewanella sp. OPT22]
MHQNNPPVINIFDALQQEKDTTGTGLLRAHLVDYGDYAVTTFEMSPNRPAATHYHTFGDFDFFVIIKGSGQLHLAQVEDDKIVPGSEEIKPLKQGDFCAVSPYTLHGMEALENGMTVMGFAPKNHNGDYRSSEQNISTDYFEPK